MEYKNALSAQPLYYTLHIIFSNHLIPKTKLLIAITKAKGMSKHRWVYVD